MVAVLAPLVLYIRRRQQRKPSITDSVDGGLAGTTFGGTVVTSIDGGGAFV